MAALPKQVKLEFLRRGESPFWAPRPNGMVPPAFASRRPSILLIARITDALAAFDSHAYSPYVPPRATRSKQIAAECRAVHVLAIRRGLTMQRTSGVGRFRDRGLVRDLRNVLVSRLSALFYYSERNTARTKKKKKIIPKIGFGTSDFD